MRKLILFLTALLSLVASPAGTIVRVEGPGIRTLESRQDQSDLGLMLLGEPGPSNSSTFIDKGICL